MSDTPSMSKKQSFGWGSQNLALLALGFNGVAHGALTLTTATGMFAPESIADDLASFDAQLSRLSSYGIWLGALAFLPWLHTTYARARVIASTPELELGWVRGPVAAFFIPILGLVRPFQAVRALDQALDPDRLPPAVRRVADASATYRDPAVVVATEERRTPSAPIALWWSFWIARMFTGAAPVLGYRSHALIAFHNLVVTIGAATAVLVVWRISARLDEVERRTAALEPSRL